MTYRILLTIPDDSDLLTGPSGPPSPQAILDLLASELRFADVFDPTDVGNCKLELLPDDAEIIWDPDLKEISWEAE
jgi:hypothetical protein